MIGLSRFEDLGYGFEYVYSPTGSNGIKSRGEVFWRENSRAYRRT